MLHYFHSFHTLLSLSLTLSITVSVNKSRLNTPLVFNEPRMMVFSISLIGIPDWAHQWTQWPSTARRDCVETPRRLKLYKMAALCLNAKGAEHRAL